MPLDATSPRYHHILQNTSLILLALTLTPIITVVTILSHCAALIPRSNPACHGDPHTKRTVLVTGVGMSKGLFIARAFHQAGHVVIGADFEPWRIPVCGRFSRALQTFYRLAKPTAGARGSPVYVDELVRIVKREAIDLWISCSGVASATEDAEAAEAVEGRTSCRAVQFGVRMTGILHQKDTFIQQTHDFGLAIPETHRVSSIDDALAHLRDATARDCTRRFIMKPVGMDDVGRADIMTLLPRPTAPDTLAHLHRLHISPSRPYILQQFIDGPEYCTHAIVIRGQIAAFTACRSAELLLHYTALPASSDLFQAMQRYTEAYAARMGDVSGHFSIDFMVSGEQHGRDLAERLFPIECNPRAHTAVVLFRHSRAEMVDAYLRILDRSPTSRPPVIPLHTPKCYWLGHDVVTRGLLPFLSRDDRDGGGAVRDLLEHALHWKDGTYEAWDPWPFWWLYCVCWPALFLQAMLCRNWWSKCNVSTMKLFRC